MKKIILIFTFLTVFCFYIRAESDAVITWLNFPDSTSLKSLNLKFGINARSQILDFDVVVNNQEVKGLNAINNDGYDMVRTKSVLLNKGQNTIEAIAKTTKGITKSKKTIVVRSPENPINIIIGGNDNMDFDKLYIGALSGNSHLQYLLGKRYLTGDQEVEKDLFESSLWFRESAMEGDHDGEYEYACALMEGRGILKNIPLGIKYLKLASESNHPAGMLKLGICYETGQGVKKDLEKAKALYSKCPLKEAKQRLNALIN